jgi:dipeptidyl aminopeptidase/acylaminoacyl peptidase
VSHIWRVNADGSGTVQLTNGARGESSPRWSPDGSQIAFVATRSDTGQAQVYLISNAGGEARQVTTHATGVSNIAWAPSGDVIYFIAAEPKTAEEKAKDRVKDDVYAFDENYKQRHVWKVSVPGGAEQRITEGDYSVQGYSLSRDGRRMVHQRAPSPLLETVGQSEVWVMDADGGHALQLTRNAVTEGSTALSPDGSQVLFVAQANDRFDSYYNRNLFLVPSGGGASTLPVPDLPYEVEDADWSGDGRAIVFIANMGVHSEVFQLDLASKKLTQLTDGQHAIGGWSYDPKSGRQIMVFDEPADPGEAWIFQGSGAPQRVTHVYDDLARRFRLPRQERITWKGADGVTVEGLLYYPTDYQAGTRYPLAVQTHGGPQASDKFGFGDGTTSYTPVLTARGYAVLKPNYRGSTGYGNGFLRDMVGHYFKNAHLDVLAGVDQVIRMGVADSSKLAKMGWSGGGHMTNKIITFTNRFKAAASGAGAANWISMYAQSDTRIFRTPWFGGTPWQKNAPIDVYWENSPLKYVSNVKTPTIFFVGEEDPRVPKPQSVEMYRALKSNGVPTHLYVAPREPHGWGELRHQLFKMNVELAWFEKYVTGREYTWERAPGDEKPAADGESK